MAKDPVASFLATQNLAALENALVFETSDKFSNKLCYDGLIQAVGTIGLAVIFCPIQSCFPGMLVPYFKLKLDKDYLKSSSAYNDFCWHKAIMQKTVPLEKVQDVSLSESCVQTCFGLKSVNIETAGSGFIEISAGYLAHPEQARDAIQLAVRLYRARADTAPGQHNGMSRVAADGCGSGTSLTGRLELLDQLVMRGALDSEEAKGMRLAVLDKEEAASSLAKIAESHAMLEKGLISADEWRVLKASQAAKIARA